MREEEIEQFLEYTLDICRRMVECGAEARRVESTAAYLTGAYGFELRCANAMNAMVEISIKSPSGHHYTQAARVLMTGTDLGKLERLNDLARKICAKHPDVKTIGQWIEAERAFTYPVWMEFVGYLTMTFGFALFFGGSILDGIASALISIVVFALNLLLNHFIQASQNKLFYTFFACFLSGCLALTMVGLGLGVHPDKIMIGDVMMFIPGLNIVNGVRELFYRDIITGLYRLIEALMLAVAITAGFGIAILAFGGALV